MTIKTMKLKVRDWLFPDYRQEVEIAVRSHRNAQEKHEAEIKRLSQYTPVDALREQLKGFDPRYLNPVMYDSVDNIPSIVAEYESEESEEAFLAHARDLYNNPALMAIINYLVRDQIIYTAKEALNFNDVQFGRASINGLILFKDEVEKLKAIYEDKHAKPETFDTYEVT